MLISLEFLSSNHNIKENIQVQQLKLQPVNLCIKSLHKILVTSGYGTTICLKLQFKLVFCRINFCEKLSGDTLQLMPMMSKKSWLHQKTPNQNFP